MKSVGVIGYGYWGPNVVRNFFENETSSVAMVSDLDPKRLDSVRLRYPTVNTTPNHRELIESNTVDIVANATPMRTHFDLAMAALRAGKHVLVEKPITQSSAQAELLIEEADKRRLTLAVDHTFIYTGAVRRLKELVQTSELGRIYYYDSERVN